MKSPPCCKFSPRSLDKIIMIKTQLEATYSHQMNELLIDFLTNAREGKNEVKRKTKELQMRIEQRPKKIRNVEMWVERSSFNFFRLR